ncbi:hypothetical protein JKF63_01491 [Porcisia hertigi]|uniref:C3H1-type domain-containing protein n=1 Tax=Porcisia hertigi TaxID=2761500 RepID=A0A836I9F3_9TRYP|nr:hypothetical protein JKF63_01491 [Porcisia hertigi]
MSGLDAYGKAMGEVQSDRQTSSSSHTAALCATPNPTTVDAGIAAHADGSPVDNDIDEHVPPVIAHVRRNFGVLAPTIETFIFRSGCLNESVVDVYNRLSICYPAIVDAALKQVRFEEFTMQMQIMLTQILSEEFGDDTEYLVNIILACTDAGSLFLSLLSKSMLDQVVTFAQSVMGENMYAMSYNMQGGGRNAEGGSGGGGGVGNYYRGAQQQHGYRNVGENGAPRDPRSSSVSVGPPHQDGAPTQKPYRSSGLPPQTSDAGRERSGDELRVNSDALSQREEGRDWGVGAVPPRGATGTGGSVRVDSSLGPRGAAAVMSGLGASAISRTDMSASRLTSDTASGAGMMSRHTHHLFSSSTAASGPSAKSSSMERGAINVSTHPNYLTSRGSPASSQARVPTPGASGVSLASTTSPMPTIGRAGPAIPMHHHHHHVGLGAMATNSAAASDWAAGNSASGSAPNMGTIAQRTLTPPTPQSAPMQQHQLQQLQPARTMNIPAPLSVQRRTEKNAAAAAAAAAATNAAAASTNGSAPTNSTSTNSSTAVVDAVIVPRTMSAPLSGNTNVSAPRGAHSLVHHQHHMPVLHHHHHHHHHRNFTAPPVAVTAAVQPRSPTHSPSASEERVATTAADSTSSPALETNSSTSVACASPLANVTFAGATRPPLTSAPPPALRGVGRIPIHHHHHHHIHLMVNKVEATTPALPQRQQQQQQIPAASQPPSQPQCMTPAIDLHEQQPHRQQQPERRTTSSGRWPNQKEELRGLLLAARVSESAVNYLLTNANIDELRGLKYVDFERRLRGWIPLMLDRQRIRQALLDSAPLQGQMTDNDDSATSLSRKNTTLSVGTEEEANGSGMPRRTLTVSSGVQSPLTPQQSSPTSKTGVQVPQPRTKMQQQQQQLSQQSVSGGSAIASPTDTGLALSEKETAKRDVTKTGSPATASVAPTSPVPTPTPAPTPTPVPTPTTAFSSNTRNEETDDGREEEQRRGGGRRGGKRGGMGRGNYNSTRVCRFFGTAEGCQFGDKCHYLHSK